MIELTLENFEAEVTNADGPVMVDWWGEACTSCIALFPAVAELEEEFGDKVKFTKFNTSQKGVRRFCIQEKIMGLPVFNIYKGGVEVERLTKEECTKEGIKELLSRHL